MKKEAREVLSVVGRREREAFIDEAIVAHNQAQLPDSVRQNLLLQENKRLAREAAAREMYVTELEEEIKELKKSRNYKVQHYIVPSEVDLPPDKEERLRIKTNERVIELTRATATLQKHNKRLKKDNNNLVGILARNNLTLPSTITNEEENR